MKHFLSLSLLTGVYLLLGSGNVWAEGDTAEAVCMKKPTEAEQDSCMARLNRYKTDSCKDKEKEYNDAFTKLMTACKDSGMGGSTTACRENFEKCAEAYEGENEVDPKAAITGVLGLPTFGDVQKRCPNRQEEAKDLEKELKDSKKDFDEVQKDIVKAQKDNADTFSKLQKEIAEVQKQHTDDQVEFKNKLRKEESDRTSTLASLNSEIEKDNAAILKADTDHAKMLGDQAQKLSSLSNAMIQIQCESKLAEVVKGMKINMSGNSGSMVKSGANRKKTLQEGYNQCIEQMLNARAQLVENSNKLEAEYNYAIQTAKTNIQRKRDQVAQFQQQAAEAAKDAQTANDAMEQKYQQELLRLSNQLQNQSKNAASEEMLLNQKLITARSDYYGKSNELGTIDKRFKGKKESYDAPSTAFVTFDKIRKEYPPTCCPLGKDSNYAVCKDPEYSKYLPSSGTTSSTTLAPAGTAK